jgi:hypothetical protein
MILSAKVGFADKHHPTKNGGDSDPYRTLYLVMRWAPWLVMVAAFLSSTFLVKAFFINAWKKNDTEMRCVYSVSTKHFSFHKAPGIDACWVNPNAGS